MALVSSERGQLLATGAFVIAVLLVIIATILNSVIFIQNLDSRADTVGRADPPSFSTDVQESYQGFLERTNVEYYSSYSNIEGDVSDGTRLISDGLAVEYTGGGHITAVTVNSLSRGTNVTQNQTVVMDQPGTGANTWTIATNVDRSARAEVLPQRDTLPDASGGSIPLVDALSVEISTSSATHTTYVYRNDSTVYVDSRGPSVTDLDQCTVVISSNRLVPINFEQQTVDGNDCDQLDYYPDAESSATGEFDVEMSGGLNSESGQYYWTLETPLSNVDASYDRTPPFDTGSYAKRIIFAIEYDILYQDRLNEYQDSVQVNIDD